MSNKEEKKNQKNEQGKAQAAQGKGKKKKEGEEKEAWKGGENVERHKSGARGEPGSTAAARAAFQAHRQRTRTAPACQDEHREATGPVPHRKGLPAPPGAGLMWGTGSAGQHTVISMLGSVGTKKLLLVLV